MSDQENNIDAASYKAFLSGRVYLTAFPDMKEFRKNFHEIAWESEVWIIEILDHMIHFNGDRFMGPR